MKANFFPQSLFLNSRQSQIEKIAKHLCEKFDQDVLLYFQIHDLQGFEYTKGKDFVFTHSLPQSLDHIYAKKYVEFRFLCKSKEIISTKNAEKFFSSLQNKSQKNQFFLIPYFDVARNLISTEEQEYFHTCSFDFEFNVKIYPHMLKLELKSEKKTKYIEKIYLDIQALLKDEHRGSLVSVHPERPPAVVPKEGSREDGLSLPEQDIKQSIESIKKHMNKGDCYLANMTYTTTLQDNKFLSYQDFIASWFKLKSRFGIFFEKPKMGLACFSPERFLLCKNDDLLAEPIKGTLAIRGGNPKRSDANNLWKIKKEIYEHTLIVDLIRNDLNTFCLPGSVQVYKPFQACIAGKLLQMQTSIFGKKKKTTTPGQCVSAMLPAGSVTGTPKKKVCELISLYEKNTRGYYTGVCGILEPNGDFDSCVLIRSLYKGQRGTYLGVGAGITTLSSPMAEVEEFKVKLHSFLHGIQ